jgi:hypothetical protein
MLLSMSLAACAGGMEETAEETAAEETPPLDLAPAEASDTDGFGSGGQPEDSSSTETVPTAVPPTVEPTPDFGTIAYDVPQSMVREKPVEIILLVSPSEGADLVTVLEEELEEVNQEPQNVTTT